jgi:hypothetical protein
MKRSARWVFVFLLLAACESKKEKNAFLFILSFDPLDYFSASSTDFGSGLNLDTADVINTAGDGISAIGAATITTATGTGFVLSDSTSLITTPDRLDVEAYFNLNDNTRRAFVSVASQNINSCSGAGVLASVTCSLGGFVIDIGSLLSTATDVLSLQISGINRDGDGVSSNTLSAKKYILRRVFSIASGITDAQNFVVHDNKLYFNANTDVSNSFLMSYDGSALSQVVDLGGGAVDDAFPLKSFSGQLLVSANDVGAAYTLHSLEGTTLNEIIDLNAGAGDAIGTSVEFGGDLYISIAGSGTSNIYRYDGTRFDQMTNDLVNSSLVRAAADDGVYYFLDAAVAANDGLYRLNPTAAIANRKVTDNTYDHSASEYFVLNGDLYFTAFYGGNNQTFMVDGDTVKRVASFAMTGISVYNNVAYGIIKEGGFNNLYRYTGTVFERLNPDSIRISENPVTTSILATASGVYFVRDTDPLAGNSNEFFRYQSRRFERLFSSDNVAAGSSTQRIFEYNSEIYFTAYTGAQGNLFKLEAQ